MKQKKVKIKRILLQNREYKTSQVEAIWQTSKKSLMANRSKVLTARWLVIKATNHARHFFLSRGFRSASGYLGSVRCLAIIRRFISDECRTKKYFQYAENMIPLFLVILKFCSTKHLFKIQSNIIVSILRPMIKVKRCWPIDSQNFYKFLATIWSQIFWHNISLLSVCFGSAL